METQKKLFYGLAFSAVLLGGGCATESSNNQYLTANAMLKPTVFKPVFEIPEAKITGKGEAGGFFNFDFGSVDFGKTVSSFSNSAQYVPPSIFEGLSATEAEALRNAIFVACEDNNAEFLFAPHYKIKTRKFPLLHFIWSKSYCTVYGIPARVKNVEIDETSSEVNIAISAATKENKDAKK